MPPLRIFLAGATGAIGRPLVTILGEAGHHVTALTRSAVKAQTLRTAGIEVVLGNVFDAAALETAVAAARPDIVINQVTDLPQTMKMDGLREAYKVNNRVRRAGTRNLVNAARRAGVSRFISQSVAFWYAPEGPPIKSESDPLYHRAPEPIGEAVAALESSERAVLEPPDLAGVVLRYGFFYGPGTWIAKNGAMATMLAKGRYPIIGGGHGVYSFIHVTDAARATAGFLDRGAPGVYNVVDDDPTPVREWLPVFAATIRAPKPQQVPEFAAALLVGRGVVSWMSSLKPASNAKVKRELGWQPQYTTWRRGFAEALD